MKRVPLYTVLALLTGLMLACSASSGGRSASAGRSTANLLTRETILNTNRANAFEVINALRPNWLVRRGSRELSPGENDVVIYYGNSRLGGPESLRSILPDSIERIEFLTAAAAGQRFGLGHENGVILITPKGLGSDPGT